MGNLVAKDAGEKMSIPSWCSGASYFHRGSNGDAWLEFEKEKPNGFVTPRHAFDRAYPIFLVRYRRICTRVASQVQISPVSPTSNLTCDLNIFSSAHPAGQCASFRVIRYNFVSTSMFLLCLLFARVSSPIGAFIWFSVVLRIANLNLAADLFTNNFSSIYS